MSAAILFTAAIPAIGVYWWVLGRIDQIAAGQKETLITELCRA
jgi:hypothetical protein